MVFVHCATVTLSMCLHVKISKCHRHHNQIQHRNSIQPRKTILSVEFSKMRLHWCISRYFLTKWNTTIERALLYYTRFCYTLLGSAVLCWALQYFTLAWCDVQSWMARCISFITIPVDYKLWTQTNARFQWWVVALPSLHLQLIRLTYNSIGPVHTMPNRMTFYMNYSSLAKCKIISYVQSSKQTSTKIPFFFTIFCLWCGWPGLHR